MRDHHLRAVQRIIRPPIVIIEAQPVTDLKAKVRRDRNVSAVEQPVEIRAEKDSIVHFVLAAFRVWPNVSRFKGR